MKLEARKLKDFYVENVSIDKGYYKYDRKQRAMELPNLYQGDKNLCVPYTILFIAAYIYGVNIFEVISDFMGKVAMDKKGSKPSQVLKLAKGMKLLKNYFFLKNTDRKTISQTLRVSPLAIGLWNWWRVPNQGHFMALIDETPEGWLCVNWMDDKKHDFVILPFDQPIHVAIAFGDLGDGKANSPFFEALYQVIKTFIKNLCRLGLSHK